MDEASSASGPAIFDMDLDIEEDVDACLQEFIYLSKLHMRKEAYALATSTLRRHIDFFPVFAELAAFFILSEESDGRSEASGLILDLSCRKVSFEDAEEQNYAQMVALYAAGKLFDSTMATFTGNRSADDIALTESEAATKSLFYEIDYTSIPQLHNLEVRLRHLRNSLNNDNLLVVDDDGAVVKFAIEHFHELNQARRLHEATAIFEFICTYHHNIGLVCDVMSLYNALDANFEQFWDTPTSADEIKDELLTKMSAKTALYVALRGLVQFPWPVGGDARIEMLEKEIEGLTKRLCAMIIDSEPPLSLHQWLEQRRGLRALPPPAMTGRSGKQEVSAIKSVESLNNDIKILGATGRLDIHKPSGQLNIHKASGQLNIHKASGRLSIHKASERIGIHKASGRIDIHKPRGEIHIFAPNQAVHIYKAIHQIRAYEPQSVIGVYKAKGAIHAYDPEHDVRIYKAKGEIHAYEAERSVHLHAPRDVTYLDTPQAEIQYMPQEPLPPYTTKWVLPEGFDASQVVETESDFQSIFKPSETSTASANVSDPPSEDRGQSEDVKLGTAVARVYRPNTAVRLDS